MSEMTYQGMLGAVAPDREISAGATASPVVYEKNPDGSVVVTMYMSQNGFDLLQGLARDADADLKDVIGRALVVYRDARKAIHEGKAVGVTSDPESLDVQFIDL